MNNDTWHYKELQSQSQCDWTVENLRGWLIQKDLASYQGLVSHWKDLILKATGDHLGIISKSMY